jgi:hypothetical protein
MAQTGYTPISIYYSATASNTPTAGNLVAGELAINTADGKLFYKDSAGVVQVIGTKGGVGSSSTTQVLYNSSGLVVGSANMTFNGTSLTLANDASIHGLTVGLGGGSVSGNTAFGPSALSNSGNTAANLVAIGNGALGANTTGANGTSVGVLALAANTTGTSNSAFGVLALYTNTTGQYNTGVGTNALQLNTTGGNNTAVGLQSLYSNTTASNNTAVGYQAGYSNTTASWNTSIGYQAGYLNTTGTANAFFGSQVGYSNTTGGANAAFGANLSGVALSTFVNNTTGSYNTAFGVAALASNTTASSNTAVGYGAGYSNTTGQYNVFVGWSSGQNATGTSNVGVGNQSAKSATGSFNTCIGDGSGLQITSGSYNTILGAYQGNSGGLDIRTSSNYIVLSDGAGNPRGIFDGSGNYIVGGTVACNNTSNRGNITINGSSNAILNFNSGNTTSEGGYLYWNGTDMVLQSSRASSKVACVAQSNGVVLNNGATSWSSLSDERTKDIIEPIIDATNKISTLRAVIGKYKTDKEGTRRSFLIAQDVQTVLPEAVVAQEDEIGTLSLAYTDVIPLLVASIKELNAKVTALEAQLGAK